MIDESQRDIGLEILEAIRAIKRGEGRSFTIEVSPITVAREKTGMSQAQFSNMLGVSVQTLRGWEQGNGKPSGAAQSLLLLADRKPEVLREVFLT